MRGIYLQGEYHGVYDSGSKVLARRNEPPFVEEGKHYTIDEIVQTEFGCCAKNLMIKLQEVKGLYTRKTFKVDSSCLEENQSENIDQVTFK